MIIGAPPHGMVEHMHLHCSRGLGEQPLSLRIVDAPDLLVVVEVADRAAVLYQGEAFLVQ